MYIIRGLKIDKIFLIILNEFLIHICMSDYVKRYILFIYQEECSKNLQENGKFRTKRVT